MPTFHIEKLLARKWVVHAAGVAATASLVLAFYAFFWKPSEADMQRLKDRMNQLRSLMANSDEVSVEHQRLQQRLEELRQASATARRRMPRRPTTQLFIEKLTELAQTHGLTVELCTAAAPRTAETHMQVEVTCRWRGGFAGACRFLASVDQLPQIAKASSLTMTSDENSRQYPMEAIFQLYYRNELHDTEQKRGAL